MLFNSYSFVLLFLPVAVIGYHLINKYSDEIYGKIWLILASFVFYGFFSFKYTLLLCASIMMNYAWSMALSKTSVQSQKKAILVISIIANIALLVYYKYTDFIIENINRLTGQEIALLKMVFPVGISFYTFSQLSYMVEIYKDNNRTPKFIDYSTYMCFFPKITQGPISLYDEFCQSLNGANRKNIDYEMILKGMYAFSIGLAKKVLLADNLAKITNPGFANYEAFNSAELFIIMLSYTFQIYFDFSGYCDMAYGISLMFGIELPVNFNSPYKANSIADFWNRWHITLNRFMIRYVYIPLGGSRKGIVRTAINVLIVFTISGIWHGANWTYMAWGIINGCLVVGYRVFRKYIDKISNYIKIPVTFFITIFLMTIFRSDTVKDSVLMIKRFFTVGLGGFNNSLYGEFNKIIELRIISKLGGQSLVDNFPWIFIVIVLFVCLFCIWFSKNTKELTDSFVPDWKRCSVFVTLMTLSVLSMSQVTEFIYYNF